MRIKNNKGFTLVELIIAISILSIVLGLGYKVINGTSKVTKNQMEVFSEQQNANLVNKYLTKDLEQVRKFTEANTTLNPYTYIINEGIEGIEQIEYEVKKTDNGKFYTVTRKTSSGSIELISNYPTSSEIPFSINLVDNTENLFKVSLNGNSSSKYVFEVSSRVENDVALVETPITQGGGSNNGGGNMPSPSPTPGGGNIQTPTPDVISGEIRFTYSSSGNTSNVTVKALSTKNGIGKDIYSDSKELFKKDSYKIYAEIPIESNNLKVLLSDEDGVGIIGSADKVFCNDKELNKLDLFKSKINNNRMYIYSSDSVKVTNIKIDNVPKNENIKYTLDKIGPTMVKVEFDISTTKNSSGFVAIGFGEFKEK